MRKIVLTLCLALVSSLPIFAQDTLHVLFLGNSYTASNSLPTLIAELAAADGNLLVWDANTPGGYTLEGHSTNSTSLGKIRQGNWDYVVLQEQSQRPSFPPSQVAQEVFPYAAQLNDSIKAANSCTQTCFFMTWGRKYGDQQNCQFYPPICTFEGMQTRLRDSYLQMATDNQGLAAPAGMAWRHSRAADSTINLWSGDNSHPSLAGSYLTACVFYATLFQQTPLGNGYDGGLVPQTAQFLQNIADSTVMDSFEVWRINSHLPVADFSHSVNIDSVSFVDASSNAQNWFWDFGDGDTSSMANPSHVYGQNGTYTVTLIVDNGCGDSDILVDTVVVDQLMRLDETLQAKVELFPNPSSGMLSLRLPEVGAGMRVEVMDLRGRIVFETVQSGKEGNYELGELENGVYEIRVPELGWRGKWVKAD